MQQLELVIRAGSGPRAPMDGIVIREAEPAFGFLVDLLNISPDLSALLLVKWLGAPACHPYEPKRQTHARHGRTA